MFAREQSGTIIGFKELFLNCHASLSPSPQTTLYCVGGNPNLDFNTEMDADSFVTFADNTAAKHQAKLKGVE